MNMCNDPCLLPDRSPSFSSSPFVQLTIGFAADKITGTSVSQIWVEGPTGLLTGEIIDIFFQLSIEK